MMPLSTPLGNLDPSSTMFSVFVYGSLLPGLHNHILIRHAECIGDGEISGVLFSMGAFPAIVPLRFFKDKTLTNTVKGKVYQVDRDTMSDLDTLEGYTPGSHSNLYDRAIVPVHMKSGSTLDAFVYQASHYIVSNIAQGQNPIVPEGDWATYARHYVTPAMVKHQRS